MASLIERPPFVAADRAASSPISADVPLAVDMDGSLLRTDVLAECVAIVLFRRPLAFLLALRLLLRGRATFKARMAELALLDVSQLPLRESLLRFLEDERRRGRSIHLITAADQTLADAVAARVGLFDAVLASSGGLNLKGSRKLDALKSRFPSGFAYAGDSAADLAVWRGAESVVIVGASGSVARQARRLGKPVEAEFDTGGVRLRTWRKSLRVHQWSKNALVFAPLLLSGKLADPARLLTCILGFLIIGVAASATYMINDLNDLENDRGHRSKRMRPLAHGDMPIAHALVAAPLMLAAAIAGAILLSPPFALALAAYLITTLSYSFRLKRVALLDVMVLGGLYTLRLVMGTVLAGAVFSPWLLTFSLFFFFSMSLAKRHVEVSAATSPPDELLAGRGYKPSDAPLTLSMGVATSAAAMLVIVQYIMSDAFPSNVYGFPDALWAAPALLGLWICRIWLLAHRGELDDDPVAFAVRDRISIALGVVLAISFVVAWI